MYAVVRKTKPKDAAALLQKARQPIQQIMSHISGFVSLSVVKLPDGMFNAIAVFEEKSQAEESGRKTQDWFMQNAKNLIESTEYQVGEVAMFQNAEIPENV
jgi:hypothetical protein